MKPIDIPVVAIGPGSQPEDGDGLEFMEMPRGMFRHEITALPEPEDIGALPAARRLLNDLEAAAGRYRCGDPAVRLGLNHLDPEEAALVNQVLGEGEVSITVELEERRVQIQESVLTGIWRVRTFDRAGGLVDDSLEVADIPAVVRSHSFDGDRSVDVSLEGMPAGIQNAPALLVEIADRLRERQAGQTPHVINLTLLPLSPEDLVLLGKRLGVGPTTILSRGYGNCRIGATAKEGVWWIKYYNSQDALILNTIEIVPIPEVALAAPEDIADTAERVAEIGKLYA